MFHRNCEKMYFVEIKIFKILDTKETKWFLDMGGKFPDHFNTYFNSEEAGG